MDPSTIGEGNNSLEASSLPLSIKHFLTQNLELKDDARRYPIANLVYTCLRGLK